MRRGKWIKRSLLAVAVVLTGAAALSYWAFKGTPDYYQRPQLSAKERSDAANSAIQKFFGTSTWANDLQAGEQRSILDGAGATTGPATRPRQSHTVTFTEQELNAFFQEWSTHWEPRYAERVKDPAVVLRADRIILLGTAVELGAIASCHFQPAINERGQLRLTLESVRAGRLPMPEVVWAAQRDRLVAALQQRLPGWQAKATIAANGVANRDAVAAHMSKLLFDVLARRPREPVLFLPFEEGGRAVPVRLTAVRVTDGELTLTVESMTPADRAGLLERIREPAPAVTASVQ
ncbi:MAG: hypothetical protein M3478_14335 [Planctomycetota bacterium]|nr:hypothetical protein [Planctomycetota bacterium]